MRTAWIALAALTAYAWIAAAAQAATVKVDARPGYCGQACSKYGGSVPDIHALRVDAAPGERNAITVTEAESGWTVTDSSAALTAGENCEQVDPHTVSCPEERYGISETWVQAGDGDDSLTAGVLGPTTIGEITYGSDGVYLNGGPGNDVITGGIGPDTLDGGGGTDVLHGGAGDDLIDDTDGNEPDSDRFDGGPGTDLADYYDRRMPVRVDLRRAAKQGAGGESDRFRSIERVRGGHGNDHLTGSAAHEDLYGGTGNDRLAGRGGQDMLYGERGRDGLNGGRGDDELYGGAGRDRFSAGAGDDVIGSRDEIGEMVRCGGGDDQIGEWLEVEGEYSDDPDEDIFGPDETDRLARDCELANLDNDPYHVPTVAVQPIARTATTLVFPNPCRRDCENGTLRVRSGGRSLALVRFANRRKQPRIALPVSAIPAGRRVTVRWRVDDGGIFHDSAAFRTVLR